VNISLTSDLHRLLILSGFVRGGNDQCDYNKKNYNGQSKNDELFQNNIPKMISSSNQS
jgi:hypothetical protein